MGEILRHHRHLQTTAVRKACSLPAAVCSGPGRHCVSANTGGVHTTRSLLACGGFEFGVVYFPIWHTLSLTHRGKPMACCVQDPFMGPPSYCVACVAGGRTWRQCGQSIGSSERCSCRIALIEQTASSGPDLQCCGIGSDTRLPGPLCPTTEHQKCPFSLMFCVDLLFSYQGKQEITGDPDSLGGALCAPSSRTWSLQIRHSGGIAPSIKVRLGPGLQVMHTAAGNAHGCR